MADTITLEVPKELREQKKINVELHLECLEDPEAGLTCKLKEIKTTAKDKEEE